MLIISRSQVRGKGFFITAVQAWSYLATRDWRLLNKDSWLRVLPQVAKHPSLPQLCTHTHARTHAHTSSLAKMCIDETTSNSAWIIAHHSASAFPHLQIKKEPTFSWTKTVFRLQAANIQELGCHELYSFLFTFSTPCRHLDCPLWCTLRQVINRSLVSSCTQTGNILQHHIAHLFVRTRVLTLHLWKTHALYYALSILWGWE